MQIFKISLLVFSLLALINCASNGGGDNVLQIGFTDLIRLAFTGDDDLQTETPRSEFHQAIVSGDLNTVKQLGDSKIIINTPLADISSMHKKQYLTALGEAVKYNHTEISRYLLERGANPNSHHTASPLLYALDNKNLSLAKMLLEFDVDPDDYDDSKISLLMIMVDEGYLDAVWLLLENGADPLLETKSGDTAYSIAKAKNDSVSQQLILKAKKKWKND